MPCKGVGERIRCKKCGDSIQSEWSGQYVTCSCGKTSVDGTEYYTRMIGDCWEYDPVDETNDLENRKR